MKIVGTLDTKDDGDLLPDVLDSLEGFDAIFAYNDGSQDNTEDVLAHSSKVTDYVNRDDFDPSIVASVPQHRRRHLLQWVKAEFKGEDVWVIRLEGDRFFRNQTPKQMVARAEAKGYAGLAAAMVDFRLCPQEDWREWDSWPDWRYDIRDIQNYARVDDVHPLVAFKLIDNVHYENHKIRPWPRIEGPTDYCGTDFIHKDMCLMEHHGRRGPRYWSWAYGTSGSRAASKRWPKHWDFSTPATAFATIDDGPFRPPNLWPEYKLEEAIAYWNSKNPFDEMGG